MEAVESNDKHVETDRRAFKKDNRNWWACVFILANNCCVNIAYYGMSTNLVNYLKDRLNEGNKAAANNVTNWQGAGSITPLIGAFLADAYLGRYWTIMSFSMFNMLGIAVLTISASVKGLKPSCHDGGCDVTATQSAAFFVGLYLIALSGGMTPCMPSFGADQFDESDEAERGRQSSFFNWFYLSINLGSLVGGSVLVWVQTSVGWGWGFGIPSLVNALAILVFLSGTPLYRRQPPGGSPLTRIAQVVVAALRKSDVETPSDESLLYETADGKSAIQGCRRLVHTDQFRFLDKAAVETPEDKTTGSGPASSWRLCTVTQVEELKCVLRLLPVWASGIIFSAVYTQMSTTFILQGDTLDPRMGPHFKIPAAVLSIFDTISVIIWVPIYDRAIVPLARRLTGQKRGFTQLTRMGIGLVISMFAMLAAGILEVIRLRLIARKNMYESAGYLPMSIFWQVPQYFIVGAAETFTFIGQLEFFYDQAPDAMRSLCSGLSNTSFALGNYLSTMLVTIVARVTTEHGKVGWIPDDLNRGHLDYFFWLLALLSLFNFAVYLLIARWYTYKKTID